MISFALGSSFVTRSFSCSRLAFTQQNIVVGLSLCGVLFHSHTTLQRVIHVLTWPDSPWKTNFKYTYYVTKTFRLRKEARRLTARFLFSTHLLRALRFG